MRRASAAEALLAQRSLEREVAGQQIPMAGPGYRMEFRGRWANPPGWKGRWMAVREPSVAGDLVFAVCEFAPPLYVAVPGGVDRQGNVTARRIPPPLHLQRTRRAPKIVSVGDHADYLQKLKEGWVDAEPGLPGPGGRTAGLPRDLQAMILDCYGPDPRCATKGCAACRSSGDLTPVMRRICAEELGAREAKQREAASAPTTPPPAPARKPPAKRRGRA